MYLYYRFKENYGELELCLWKGISNNHFMMIEVNYELIFVIRAVYLYNTLIYYRTLFFVVYVVLNSP